MIQIERVREVEPKGLSRYSLREWWSAGAAGGEVLKRSADVWRFSAEGKTVAYLGVIVPSLTSRPMVWFLLGKAMRPIYLRMAREVMRVLLERYGVLETCVDLEFAAGQRFAQFAGFRPTGQVRRMWGDVVCLVYEAR